MINTKCNNIHKYGPFKKKNNEFYRTCLKCNKKTKYPNYQDIEKEYNNQLITDYIINIISKKDINKLQNNIYFYKYIICLFDNNSYIFLSKTEQTKLIDSLKELNYYFNKNDKIKYDLTKDIINYLKKYFTNYNNEIENKYNEKTLDLLDKEYIILSTKLNIELESIIENEENTIVTINEKDEEINNSIDFQLNEIENESN